MRQVYAPLNSVEAQLIAHFLKHGGITAFVLDSSSAAGEIPLVNMHRLMVADDEYDAARALIHEWENAPPETADSDDISDTP